ncbi:MAG: HK97 family phage prohead protease [Roseibium sp.]
MSGQLKIAGYASLFSRRDGAGDCVEPGAFRMSLRQRPASKVAMLWQHDPAIPIGRWTRLVETSFGLWVEGYLAPGVLKAREAAHLISEGASNGLSIGFKAKKAHRDLRSAERCLKQIDLWEISLVTFPQVEEARVRLLPAAQRRR